MSTYRIFGDADALRYNTPHIFPRAGTYGTGKVAKTLLATLTSGVQSKFEDLKIEIVKIVIHPEDRGMCAGMGGFDPGTSYWSVEMLITGEVTEKIAYDVFGWVGCYIWGQYAFGDLDANDSELEITEI